MTVSKPPKDLIEGSSPKCAVNALSIRLATLRLFLNRHSDDIVKGLKS